MNLQEYQEKARSTAIYLDIENTRMLYPALGIIGECGEIAEKIKKLIRDSNWDMDQKRKDAIAKELGDCCWYLANICCDTNLDLNMMYEMRGASIVQHIRILNLPQLVLHMNRHATLVAGALENLYYDFEVSISNSIYDHNEKIVRIDRFPELPNSLSNLIVCIEEIGRKCDFTLEEICIANIEKLAGRKKRGTLTGDGDTR